MTEVVWITRTYPWRDQPGAGFFYQSQAQALSRLGLSITVACPTPMAPWPLPELNHRWRLYADAPVQAKDAGVDVIRPRYPNVPGEPSWARPDRHIAATMWRARDRWTGAKLIHGHYSVTGLAAWRLAAKAQLPFVLTFHGSDINSWPNEHPERMNDLRAAVAQASSVIAVSGALAQRVSDLTGVVATHLPLGSDHASLGMERLERDVARRRLGFPADRLVVLFVGNLKPTKGVRELADAVLQLGPPYRAAFVGAGPEYGYGANDERSTDLLDYRGALAHDEVIAHMSAADVLVLPSHSEGLPTVLVEAGSVGLPVIASRVGGIPELLEPDRGVVLPDISPASIAAALVAFAAARPAAQRSASRLRELVLERYDVDRNASRLLAIYQGIAPSIRSTAVPSGPST